MASFFKNIGRGIIYILILPFTLVGLAICAVIAFIVFICQLFVFLFRFITGRKIFEELPEDKEARLIIQRKLAGPAPQEQTNNSYGPTPNPSTITINIPVETLRQNINNSSKSPIELMQQELEQNSYEAIEQVTEDNQEEINQPNEFDSFSCEKNESALNNEDNNYEN